MHADGMKALIVTTRNKVALAWRNLIGHLREENTEAAIAERLAVGHHETAVVGVQRAATAFAAGELAAFTHAGQATARWLTEQIVKKKQSVYDPLEPGAVRWAKQNQLDAIREITNDQRDTIRQILVNGARAGTNPKVLAREIRESIGLTQHQAQIVENYRRELEAGGAQLQNAIDRQLSHGRYDASLAAAIRDNRAVPPERIDAMVEAYRKNCVAFRAQTIDRTEGLRVAHQASDELFRQAVANGDLQAEQIERKWVHGPKRKDSRDYHISMNGQLRGFGEPFLSGHGVSLMFAGDPAAPIEETAQCTCVVTTRIRRVIR